MNAPVAKEMAATLDQSVILEAIGVSMVFPGTIALDNADFVVRKSAVTALVGENGAGKSTLMKIIAGIYARDCGSYRLDGVDIDELTPKKAQELGIAIIHQELNMCTDLTVAENMFLGREANTRGVVRQREMDEAAREILQRGITTHLITVDTSQCDGRFCGRRFDASLLAELPPDVDPCGENGEFHTLVTNMPGFSSPLTLIPGEIDRSGRFHVLSYQVAD